MFQLNHFFAAASVLASAAAFSAPLVQDVRVNADLYAGHSFLVGDKSAGGVSASASGSELYWYDTATNAAVGAISGGASLAVQNVSQVRGSHEQLTAFPVAVRTTLKHSAFETAGWSIDLGANLLVSNLDGYQVTGSSIRVVDFGNAAQSPAAWFDFTVGLWNGTDLVLADGLEQVNLQVSAAAAADGTASVTYLGNNVFRFTETGMGSGASLMITSKVEGFHVRTLDTMGMGFEGTYNVADWVDLAADRVLEAVPTSEVPEPSALALAGLGLGLVGAVRRRRPRA